jgi:hypothetical protein
MKVGVSTSDVGKGQSLAGRFGAIRDIARGSRAAFGSFEPLVWLAEKKIGQSLKLSMEMCCVESVYLNARVIQFTSVCYS